VSYKESKISVTPEQASLKIRSWCAYQERSHYETRNKLNEWRLDEAVAENIIADLIAENYLNEERFASAFAGGKFRIKHWGRNKIKVELKKHRISEVNLRKALTQIEEESYCKMIQHEIEKKLRSIIKGDQNKKFYATLQYLISRGFEADLVREELKKLNETDNYEFRSEE